MNGACYSLALDLEDRTRCSPKLLFQWKHFEQTNYFGSYRGPGISLLSFSNARETVLASLSTTVGILVAVSEGALQGRKMGQVRQEMENMDEGDQR
jgi:hypothetical protein